MLRTLATATLFTLFGVATAAADPTDNDGVDDTCAACTWKKPAPSSGMFVDFGAGVERLAPGDGNTYDVSFVRFAPQTTFRKHFYIGAELDIGSFDHTLTQNTIARTPSSTTGPSTLPASEVGSGSLAAAKVVGGLRATAGIVSGGLELAAGVRYVRTTDVNGMNIGDEGATVVEARGRLDLWLTPSLSVGGIVGKELTNTENMMVGLQLGVHFEPFDHSR